MLILSRKTEEVIRATCPSGEVIDFKILIVRNGTVKVGITAPKHIPIARLEILETDPATARTRKGSTGTGRTQDADTY